MINEIECFSQLNKVIAVYELCEIETEFQDFFLSFILSFLHLLTCVYIGPPTTFSRHSPFPSPATGKSLFSPIAEQKDS
jgi:hypothetical protein